MKLWPFKVEKDENINKSLILIELNKKAEKFYPKQIICYDTFRLEEFLGKKIKNAVITVLAYFNEGKRKLLKKQEKL